MQKLMKFVVSGILLAGLLLSGCAPAAAPTTLPENAPEEIIPEMDILPTPTPTEEIILPPEETVSDGQVALLMGDYETARKIFQAAIANASEPGQQSQNQLGLGQAYYQMNNLSAARDQFQAAADSEDPAIAGRAYYMLGQTFTRLERYDEALEAYDSYLTIKPGLLDSHIHELRASLYTTFGDTSASLSALEEAYLTHPAGGSEPLSVKIAVAHQTLGEVETAISLYQNILNTTTNDYTKAEMNLRLGRIYLEQENPDLAYDYLQAAVNGIPYAYDAYTALVILVEAGIPVDEYQRGLINYNMGNYALAIEAFDRHLASGVEVNADGALYHKALATRALSSNDMELQYEAAITLWEQLILDYPTSSYYVDAWESIEFTLWAYLGEPQKAAEHALTFVAQRPESTDAPNFLFLAGRSYERADMLPEAADTWARLAGEYPNSDETFRATYFAGITHVRMGDWESAKAQFSRALVLANEPSQLAAAHLWIGKCQQAQGDISAALDSWKIAQTSDPFGHYSIRAEDLLIGREPFADPQTYDLNPDLTPYRLEAETWLRQTFNLPADTNLESPGLLANDPRFQRGIEFWTLGNYQAGKAEFDALRSALSDDPAQTFRLIPALVEIGLYRSALAASTDLLKLAGLEGAAALQAPEFFSRIRFGAYYLDWLLPTAQDEDISPLLLLSVIRQESAYEGFIASGAGASGLMQIMPATGAQLAAELGWPENYTEADLNRPYISLVFGANYLKRQRNYFEGDTFAMLAAYNGGPGNTVAWKGLMSFDDPDLFLEIIRIEETRNYIRLINEIHYIYAWLYGEQADR